MSQRIIYRLISELKEGYPVGVSAVAGCLTLIRLSEANLPLGCQLASTNAVVALDPNMPGQSDGTKLSRQDALPSLVVDASLYRVGPLDCVEILDLSFGCRCARRSRRELLPRPVALQHPRQSPAPRLVPQTNGSSWL